MDLVKIKVDLNTLGVFNIPTGLLYYLNYLKDKDAATTGYAPFQSSPGIPKYSVNEIQKFRELKEYFETLFPETFKILSKPLNQNNPESNEASTGTVLESIRTNRINAISIVVDRMKDGDDNDAKFVAESIITSIEVVYQLN